MINWEIYLLSAMLIFAGGIGTGWHEKSIRVPAIIESQKNVDVSACKDSQAITKETNDALQKDRDDIAKRLAALKLQPATCVPVAGTAKLPASGGKHAGSHGITSDALREFAATCEGYRRSLISCSLFIDNERVDDKR